MNFTMKHVDGRSVMLLRTQSDTDETWRHNLTPKLGEHLVIEDIDDLHFNITCAPLEGAALADLPTPADGEQPLPPLQTMSRDDMKVLCAKRGIKVPRNANKFSLIQLLTRGE